MDTPEVPNITVAEEQDQWLLSLYYRHLNDCTTCNPEISPSFYNQFRAPRLGFCNVGRKLVAQIEKSEAARILRRYY